MKNFHRIVALLLLLASVGPALFVGVRIGNHLNFEGLSTLSFKDSMSGDFTISIPDYNTVPQEQAEKATISTVAQQQEMQNLLLRQLKQDKLTNSAKANIIFLLGATHTAKAVSILIENINFTAKIPSSNLPPISIPGMWNPYVARSALSAIGRHASDGILRYIGTKPPVGQKFDSSKIDGFVAVLYNIEKPHWALLKLEEKQKESNDPQVKAQYQMVIDKFKKMVPQA